MKSRLNLVCMIVICASLVSPAIAATIKKKNGQVIKGEINGRIVQKGKIEKSDTGWKSSISFNVINGKDIDTIDGRGVNLVKESRHRTVLFFFNSDAPPTDERIFAFTEGVIDINSRVDMNIPGGLLTIVTFENWKNLAEPLLGELVEEGKKVRFLPSIRITAEQGIVEIPISEIVEFRDEGDKQNQGKKTEKS